MSASLVKPDGSALVFDATLRIAYSRTIATSDHPIEDGSTITDHAQDDPLRVSVTGVVSETPLAASSATTSGTARILAAIDFLASCRGVLLSFIDPRKGTFTNMLLTQWPDSTDLLRRSEFAIELKQVTIATAASVTLSNATSTSVKALSTADATALASSLEADAAARALAANAKLAAEVDTGTQPTSSTASDPSAEAADQSLLLTLAQSIGAV